MKSKLVIFTAVVLSCAAMAANADEDTQKTNVLLILTDDKSDDLVGSAIGSARNTENRRY